MYKKVTKKYALGLLNKRKDEELTNVFFDYGKGKQEIFWSKYISKRKDAVPHLYTYNKRGLSHPVFKEMLERATLYTDTTYYKKRAISKKKVEKKKRVKI